MRLFIIILFCCQAASANNSFLEALSNATPKQVNHVDLNTLLPNQIYLTTPFAKPFFIDAKQKKLIHEKVILKIELVYTRFRSSTTFNQQQLNNNRLKKLQQLLPHLFDAPLWDFELLEQTNGNSRVECNQMFHGFILTYRPSSSQNTLLQEANYVNKLVDLLKKNDSLTNDSTPKEMFIKTHYDPKWGYIHDTNYIDNKIPMPSPPDFFYNQQLFNDSTVLNAFARNSDWKNFIVVTDVTGSMSPYSSQVFVWLKHQATNDQAKFFVFFNDGDTKASSRKKPLNTKGIYTSKNKGIDEVTKAAVKCMLNGSGGGENLENDVEAIIEGTKYYTNADAIILIADNLESMRDYDFIDKINKPVHVILCGADYRINIQYLDLAKQTKGSVHTKYSDVLDLDQVKNGQEITIDDKTYRYENNRFHFVYESFKYQNKTPR